VAEKLARSHRAQGLAVGVYKPVASDCLERDECMRRLAGRATGGGIDVETLAGLPASGPADDLDSVDAIRLWLAADRPGRLDQVCPQRFRLPLAPDEAARRDGRRVDGALLVAGAECWRDQADVLIVEGAGGLFSPLSDDRLNIDLYQQLVPLCDPDEPELVLVAANRLGVIHDVIAVCTAAAQRGVAVDRLYLSSVSQSDDQSRQSNAAQIRRWLPDLSLTEVGWGG